MIKTSKRLTGICAFALALLVTGPAISHPHVFAEARLEVVAGDDGKIAELHHVWRFDEVFSSSVVMDFDKNRNLVLDPDELEEVGKTVRDSLSHYGYYTMITANGQEIKVAKPDVINVDFQDGRLLMFFAVKPERPIPLAGKLTFGVYDPTFYTSIDFAKDSDMVTMGKALERCQRQVVRPDADQVLADNKDKLTQAFFDDPAGTNMSKLFAIRLEVTCQ